MKYTHDMKEKFSHEIKILRRNQSEILEMNSVCQINNTVESLNSRLSWGE